MLLRARNVDGGRRIFLVPKLRLSYFLQKPCYLSMLFQRPQVVRMFLGSLPPQMPLMPQTVPSYLLQLDPLTAASSVNTHVFADAVATISTHLRLEDVARCSNDRKVYTSDHWCRVNMPANHGAPHSGRHPSYVELPQCWCRPAASTICRCSVFRDIKVDIRLLPPGFTPADLFSRSLPG